MDRCAPTLYFIAGFVVKEFSKKNTFLNPRPLSFVVTPADSRWPHGLARFPTTTVRGMSLFQHFACQVATVSENASNLQGIAASRRMRPLASAAGSAPDDYPSKKQARTKDLGRCSSSETFVSECARKMLRPACGMQAFSTMTEDKFNALYGRFVTISSSSPVIKDVDLDFLEALIAVDIGRVQNIASSPQSLVFAPT